MERIVLDDASICCGEFQTHPAYFYDCCVTGWNWIVQAGTSQKQSSAHSVDQREPGRVYAHDQRARGSCCHGGGLRCRWSSWSGRSRYFAFPSIVGCDMSLGFKTLHLNPGETLESDRGSQSDVMVQVQLQRLDLYTVIGACLLALWAG